jgi:cytidine deaminase
MEGSQILSGQPISGKQTLISVAIQQLQLLEGQWLGIQAHFSSLQKMRRPCGLCRQYSTEMEHCGQDHACAVMNGRFA